MKRSASLLLLFLICCGSVRASDFIIPSQFRMKVGDDLRWAQPDWDDSEWTPIALTSVPPINDIVWLRTTIRLSPDHFVPGHPLGIHFEGLASEEIFWDGFLIGRGGRPARVSEQEVPGPIQTHYVLPERLSALGNHVLAIRSSAHHRHFQPLVGYWIVVIGDYDDIVDIGRYTTSLSLISLSAMLLVAIIAFLLFLIDREDRSYLLLSLLGIVAALLLIAEAWRNLYGYTYNWHLLRISIIAGLTALLNLLLLLFVIIRFPASRGKWFLAVAAIGISLSMLAPGWDSKCLLMFLNGIPLCLLWTVRAAVDRRRGSLLAITGLVATAIVLYWKPYLFADLTLYFGIDFLLLCLLASHVLQVRQVRLEREDARYKSTRLELELLKKHMQPHYLMNTLTALAEWIEQEPKAATKMIQSLSNQFRVLSEVSHRSLIPLKDEIRLCLSHLEIMSKRRGGEFALSTEGVDLALTIPPAVIHTMLENAIIHNKHEPGRIEFLLRMQEEDGFYHYTLKVPLGSSRKTSHEPADGTGFRYIKARLRESYGDNWKFEAGVEGDHWKNEIWIPAQNQ